MCGNENAKHHDVDTNSFKTYKFIFTTERLLTEEKQPRFSRHRFPEPKLHKEGTNLSNKMDIIESKCATAKP